MKGNTYVSGTIKTSISESESIIVSVPVFEKDSKVNGVLYCVVQTRKFELYTDTEWDLNEGDQYIHIIDNQGNFVVRSKNKNTIVNSMNIYEDLEELHTTVPIEKIKKSLKENKVVLTKVHKKEDIRYIYFAPMETNNWYVVTVLTGDAIEEQIDYSREAVFKLLVAIALTLAALGVVCLFTFKREKRKTEKLNQELVINEKILKAVLSESEQFVFIYDVNTKVLQFINSDESKFGIPQEIEDLPNNVDKYLESRSESVQEIHRLLAAIESGVDEEEGEITIEHENRILYFRVHVTKIADKYEKAVRIVGSLENITENKKAEIKLKKGEQIRSAVLSDTIGFFEVNLNKNRVMQDGEMKNTPYTFTEVLEKFCEQKVAESYRMKVKEMFAVPHLLHMYEIGVYDFSMDYLLMTEKEEVWVTCEIHLTKDLVTDDIITLAVIRNINDKKVKEIQLKNQAKLDPLTKAYNRSVATKKINQILKMGTDRTHAFMLIDIDNFKAINDNLGHLVGDTVLIDIVNILKHHVRSEDIVCRLGGDEFVVFLRNMPKEIIHRNVTKLLEKLQLTYEKENRSGSVSCSIGIAVAPEHGTDFQSLYEKADIALYEVKANHKNSYKLYEQK